MLIVKHIRCKWWRCILMGYCYRAGPFENQLCALAFKALPHSVAGFVTKAIQPIVVIQWVIGYRIKDAGFNYSDGARR